MNKNEERGDESYLDVKANGVNRWNKLQSFLFKFVKEVNDTLLNEKGKTNAFEERRNENARNWSATDRQLTKYFLRFRCQVCASWSQVHPLQYLLMVLWKEGKKKGSNPPGHMRKMRDKIERTFNRDVRYRHFCAMILCMVSIASSFTWTFLSIWARGFEKGGGDTTRRFLFGRQHQWCTSLSYFLTWRQNAVKKWATHGRNERRMSSQRLMTRNSYTESSWTALVLRQKLEQNARKGEN